MPKAKNDHVIAGHLKVHDHFQIRSNGRWYTVHAQVVQIMDDGNTNLGRGDFFTIGISGSKMYAFDYQTKVLKAQI